MGAVVTRLLEGEVGHERSRAGTVPVPLPGLGDDGVAGADLLHRPAAGLDPPGPLEDVEDLPAGVLVPGGARPGGEVHAERMEGRRGGGGRDLVDPDGAGEPGGGAGHALRAS